MITIELIGDRALSAAYQALGNLALPVVSQSLYETGNVIIADAKENYVPVDFGHLRASGFVDEPVVQGPSTTVALGFGGPDVPYALSVHENPRAGRTFGLGPLRHGKQVIYKHYAQVGMWKYLELPWKASGAQLLEHLAESLEAAVTEMGHA